MVYERSLIAAKPINKLISEVFFKSGLMEAWGRGIPDIFDLCKENGLPKPEFELAYGYVYLTIRFAKPLTPPAAKPSSTTVSMSSKAAKSSPFRMPTPTTPGSKKSPSAPGSPSKYPTTSFAKPRPIRKPLVPMSPTSSSPGNLVPVMQSEAKHLQTPSSKKSAATSPPTTWTT